MAFILFIRSFSSRFIDEIITEGQRGRRGPSKIKFPEQKS